MSKFRVIYSKEFSKIIYARNRKEAEWKFNRTATDNQSFVEVEEIKGDGE